MSRQLFACVLMHAVGMLQEHVVAINDASYDTDNINYNGSASHCCPVPAPSFPYSKKYSIADVFRCSLTCGRNVAKLCMRAA